MALWTMFVAEAVGTEPVRAVYAAVPVTVGEVAVIVVPVKSQSRRY